MKPLYVYYSSHQEIGRNYVNLNWPFQATDLIARQLYMLKTKKITFTKKLRRYYL